MSWYQLLLVLVAVCSLGACALYSIRCYNVIGYAGVALDELERSKLAEDLAHDEPWHTLHGAKLDAHAALEDFKAVLISGAAAAVALFLL